MSTIFYGVCGEGRGHAARVKTVVDELQLQHNVHIFAPAMAYEMLAPVYRDSKVHVHEVPGLCFAYDTYRRVDFLKTGGQALRYLAGFTDQIGKVVKAIEKYAPKLVITDFEPIVSRAAERCGIPYISLDHQQFMLRYDLSSLPRYLQHHALYMSLLIKGYYCRQHHSIISSFYFPPLRGKTEKVTQIGVLLRPEILSAAGKRGSHLVAYLRRQTPPSTLQALADCGCEIRIYGLGEQRSCGNLHFYNIDFQRFIDDLATCRALISTAGNQLVGEALYLDKPVLAMPEAKNYEQHINAHFLEQSNAGMSIGPNQLQAETIRRFLDQFAGPLQIADKAILYGNPTALRIINRYSTPQKAFKSRVALPELEWSR